LEAKIEGYLFDIEKRDKTIREREALINDINIKVAELEKQITNMTSEIERKDKIIV
jgi:hypothetical protein